MFHLWPAWDTDIVLDLPCTPADLARVIEDEPPEWAPLPDNTPNVWRWRIDGARQTVWRAPGCGWLQALATPSGARLEVFLPHVLVYPYGAMTAQNAWRALSERLIALGWLVEDEEDEEPAAKRGAPRLEERDPDAEKVAQAVDYQIGLEKTGSRRKAAELAGIPEYRTAEAWMKAWPEAVKAERNRRTRE